MSADTLGTFAAIAALTCLMDHSADTSTANGKFFEGALEAELIVSLAMVRVGQ